MGKRLLQLLILFYACSAMDDQQEATWRASGQHLKLQWLSQPTTVLVVFKPVPAVFQSTVKAVAWLLQRGLTVYVSSPGGQSFLLDSLGLVA